MASCCRAAAIWMGNVVLLLWARECVGFRFDAISSTPAALDKHRCVVCCSQASSSCRLLLLSFISMQMQREHQLDNRACC